MKRIDAVEFNIKTALTGLNELPVRGFANIYQMVAIVQALNAAQSTLGKMREEVAADDAGDEHGKDV